MRSAVTLALAICGGTASAWNGVLSNRRNFMASASSAGLVCLASPPPPASAAESSPTAPTAFGMIEDADNGFQIKFPSDWDFTEQEISGRRTMKLYVDPKSDRGEKTIMFVAYTPVRDDFTSLGSFGSVEEVGAATILPKGELMGDETRSKMLKSESKKNSYFYDYTVAVPGQPERHLRTIFTLVQGATGGAGANLVTITLQTPETRYGELKGSFDTVIDSYDKFIAKK